MIDHPHLTAYRLVHRSMRAKMWRDADAGPVQGAGRSRHPSLTATKAT